MAVNKPKKQSKWEQARVKEMKVLSDLHALREKTFGKKEPSTFIQKKRPATKVSKTTTKTKAPKSHVALVNKLAQDPDVRNPEALAAWIGRRGGGR